MAGKRLSRDLTERYGNSFGMSNINKMRKFYSLYPILQTVSAKLSWSHYVEPLNIEDSILAENKNLSAKREKPAL
ncbi:DUF1016 N-terminal domain-containing protein [Oribacterium parvum]|jgi:conserved hypothetical protein|uniref:DUF1016 N-terminal domain-containing protein n=1 Tax=Oribacterium parvum TaxID=1501329 RepID=UPI0009DB7284